MNAISVAKSETKTKKWALHVCCISCATILREWLNNKGRSMPFALPMIWREPTYHLTDCYFCIVPSLQHRITNKKKRTVNYCNISSVIRPVPTLNTSLFQYHCSSDFRFRWQAYRKPGEDNSTFKIYRCWLYCWSSI